MAKSAAYRLGEAVAKSAANGSQDAGAIRRAARGVTTSTDLAKEMYGPSYRPATRAPSFKPSPTLTPGQHTMMGAAGKMMPGLTAAGAGQTQAIKSLGTRRAPTTPSAPGLKAYQQRRTAESAAQPIDDLSLPSYARTGTYRGGSRPPAAPGGYKDRHGLTHRLQGPVPSSPTDKAKWMAMGWLKPQNTGGLTTTYAPSGAYQKAISQGLPLGGTMSQRAKLLSLYGMQPQAPSSSNFWGLPAMTQSNPMMWGGNQPVQPIRMAGMGM